MYMRPSLTCSALQARVDAIEEIMNSNTYHMEKMRSLLANMPDLVKGLTRIQYGKVDSVAFSGKIRLLTGSGDSS